MYVHFHISKKYNLNLFINSKYHRKASFKVTSKRIKKSEKEREVGKNDKVKSRLKTNRA